MNPEPIKIDIKPHNKLCPTCHGTGGTISPSFSSVLTKAMFFHITLCNCFEWSTYDPWTDDLYFQMKKHQQYIEKYYLNEKSYLIEKSQMQKQYLNEKFYLNEKLDYYKKSKSMEYVDWITLPLQDTLNYEIK